MTTFLFSAVTVSGVRIISTIHFTRRNRFILTASLALGLGATLVPDWFEHVFTYNGGGAKGGFLNAIKLVMETGFALAALISIILNLIIDKEIEDDAQSITADENEVVKDEEEWAKIRGKSISGSDRVEPAHNGDVEAGQKSTTLPEKV